MRKEYSFVVILMVVYSVFCVNDIEKPFKIQISSKMEIEHIYKTGADIGQLGEDWVKVYSTQENIEELTLQGFNSIELIDTSRMNMEATMGALDWDVYHSYAEITAFLADLEYDYPTLAEYFSIGESVEGRDIWCIKISDNVSSDEFEPELCYISTMHGDEPVGTEFLLALAESLTSNYGSDPVLTRLVDSCEIYFIPLLNPDGYVSGSRRNANSMDLNRNYPVPDGSIGDDGTFAIEQENQVLIDFYQTRFFNFTINFHTGALVVNYPWDYTSVLSPEDDLLIQRSLDYSTRNLPMYTGSFSQGITNGYAWYEADGSLQDWTYWSRGDIHYTVELNNVKWPPASELAGLWEDNYEAMIFTMSRSLMGARGIVTDTFTSEPLPAQVTIIDYGFKIFCDPSIGDYHKQFLPGSYSLRFTCDGYVTKDISITVPDTGYVIYDAMLMPIVSDTIYFSDFEEDDGGLITESSSFYQDWQWGDPMSGPIDAHSGSKLWGTRLMYDYHDSSQSRLVLDVDLGSFGTPALSFWHWYRFQDWNSYGWHDGGNVKWRSDGTIELISPNTGYDGEISEHNLHIPEEQAFVGENGGWERVYFDLTDHIGESGQIIIDFGSSSVNTESGWFIDDLLVERLLPLDVAESRPTLPEDNELYAYPNPFNSSVELRLPNSETVKIYSLSGKLIFKESLNRYNQSITWKPQNYIESGVYIIKTDSGASRNIMYIK